MLFLKISCNPSYDFFFIDVFPYCYFKFHETKVILNVYCLVKSILSYITVTVDILCKLIYTTFMTDRRTVTNSHLPFVTQPSMNRLREGDGWKRKERKNRKGRVEGTVVSGPPVILIMLTKIPPSRISVIITTKITLVKKDKGISVFRNLSMTSHLTNLNQDTVSEFVNDNLRWNDGNLHKFFSCIP